MRSITKISLVFTILLLMFIYMSPVNSLLSSNVSAESRTPTLTYFSVIDPPKCSSDDLETFTAPNGQVSCRVKGDCTGDALTPANCGIIFYLIVVIDALSAIVGVTVVIMIIIGGIQYSAAGDDPQKIQAAKGKIGNALLALFIFIFMFAFLQWVVPGGIF